MRLLWRRIFGGSMRRAHCPPAAEDKFITRQSEKYNRCDACLSNKYI